MFSFLQQISATVYVAVLAATITATATLTGIFLTNKANNQRFALQLKHDQNENQRDLLRNKLEELYVLFSRWHRHVSGIYLKRRLVMEGKADFKTTLEEEKELEKKVTDLERFEMLIDLYFPGLESDYIKVMKVHREVVDIVLEHQEQCFLGNPDGRRFVTPLFSSLDKFDRERDRFAKLIAAQAKSFQGYSKLLK